MRRVRGGAGPGRETLQKCIPVRVSRVTESGRLPASHLDLRLGVDVHTSDGHHVGALQRIVVDAESWDPRALIVRETNWFSGRTLAPGAGMMVAEVIVPLNAIADAGPDGIRLILDKRATRALPPYLSYHYKPLERGDGLRFAAALAGGSLGVGPMFPLLQETADKPDGQIEIRHGENVMIGHGGEKLGTVQDVLFDEGELVGIVVRAGGFFARDVVVQVRFLDRSDDLALFLRMTPEDVKRLAEAPPAG
jgi:sporulation protein YlmC with PRC-barrel domain